MVTKMVWQHRSQQYYGKSGSQFSGRRFSYSPPPRGLNGVNCRAFHSSVGILPSPRSAPPRRSRSSPIPIISKPLECSFDEEDDDVELWAGPAYSNSPPPSSLPIPKFSLCRSRVEIAKSAPPSPVSSSSHDDILFATRDICRMLNLDTAF